MTAGGVRMHVNEKGGYCINQHSVRSSLFVYTRRPCVIRINSLPRVPPHRQRVRSSLRQALSAAGLDGACGLLTRSASGSASSCTHVGRSKFSRVRPPTLRRHMLADRLGYSAVGMTNCVGKVRRIFSDVYG